MSASWQIYERILLNCFETHLAVNLSGRDKAWKCNQGHSRHARTLSFSRTISLFQKKHLLPSPSNCQARSLRRKIVCKNCFVRRVAFILSTISICKVAVTRNPRGKNIPSSALRQGFEIKNKKRKKNWNLETFSLRFSLELSWIFRGEIFSPLDSWNTKFPGF